MSRNIENNFDLWYKIRMKQKQKLDKTEGVGRKRYEGDDTH